MHKMPSELHEEGELEYQHEMSLYNYEVIPFLELIVTFKTFAKDLSHFDIFESHSCESEGGWAHSGLIQPCSADQRLV